MAKSDGIRANKKYSFKRVAENPVKEGPFEESMVETYGYKTNEQMIKESINQGFIGDVDKLRYDFASDEDIPENVELLMAQQYPDPLEVHVALKELRSRRMYGPTGGVTDADIEKDPTLAEKERLRLERKEDAREGVDIENKSYEPAPVDEKANPE